MPAAELPIVMQDNENRTVLHALRRDSAFTIGYSSYCMAYTGSIKAPEYSTFTCPYTVAYTVSSNIECRPADSQVLRQRRYKQLAAAQALPKSSAPACQSARRLVYRFARPPDSVVSQLTYMPDMPTHLVYPNANLWLRTCPELSA